MAVEAWPPRAGSAASTTRRPPISFRTMNALPTTGCTSNDTVIGGPLGPNRPEQATIAAVPTTVVTCRRRRCFTDKSSLDLLVASSLVRWLLGVANAILGLGQ